MRLLGVDLGRVRIGLAVAETDAGIANPRPALKATGKLKADAENLVQVAQREEVDEIVIGLPIDPDGTMRSARGASQLAQLVSALGWKTHMIDETLTSVESHAAMRDVGLKASARRKRVDGEAACRILDRWMSENHG